MLMVDLLIARPILKKKKEFARKMIFSLANDYFRNRKNSPYDYDRGDSDIDLTFRVSPRINITIDRQTFKVEYMDKRFTFSHSGLHSFSGCDFTSFRFLFF